MEQCTTRFIIEETRCVREKGHSGPCCVEHHESTCPYFIGAEADMKCTCASVKEEGK